MILVVSIVVPVGRAQELLRYTDVSHKDYPDLVRASSKVEGVVASINAKAKKSEQQALMLRAAEEMDIPEVHLMSTLSNRIESNRIESNRIESNRIESNRTV